MQIRAELCHVDTLRCIVRIEAWQDNQLLGSALGEAQTSEEAEQRGLDRLMRRISPDPPMAAPQTTESIAAEAIRTEPLKHEQINRQPLKTSPVKRTSVKPASTEKTGKPSTPEPTSGMDPEQPPSTADPSSDPPSEAPTDPEDWSEELAAIDLEVQRIGWDRDHERVYLERAFGHASRHRLTRYSDLVAFLRQLREMQPGASPETASVPLRRGDLLSQGDEMIRTMGWSAAQARDFLQTELGAQSRQQLSDQQLMQFNLMLEERLLKSP